MSKFDVVPDWNPRIGETRITFEIRKDGRPLLVVPLVEVPEGAQVRECYETATEFIICGWPREDDETHDCDALGCSSVNHVLCRVRKGDGERK